MKLKLKLYLAVVYLGGILFTIYLYFRYFKIVSLWEIMFFIITILITSNASFFFNTVADIANSIILPLLFPVMVLFGPFWTGIVCMLGSIEFKYRENGFVWYKFLFNRIMFLIIGGGAGLTFKLIEKNVNINHIIAFLLASLVYFNINHLMVYMAIRLSTNQNQYMLYFKEIWKNLLFSYCFGILLNYLFLNSGKIYFVLTIVLIYIISDFIYSNIKQVNTREALRKSREELKYIKLKNTFFRNLSHELKTPLNLIFSAVQMLEIQKEKMDPENGEKIDRYTGIIRQNSYRLLRMVNNLLDTAKIDADSFSLNLTNTDIVQLVKEITDSVRDYVENKDRSLELISSIDERIIACDPQRIERILLNLLSNAVKFTEKGDTITIGIRTDDQQDNIIISVKDSGIGIKKEKQEVIFKQFEQTDDSFSRGREGSGLGLSIVKLLVEEHDGEISLKSEYGRGSEFIIILPIRTLTEEEQTLNSGYENSIDMVDIEFSDISD